jgi:hypothetical protein
MLEIAPRRIPTTSQAAPPITHAVYVTTGLSPPLQCEMHDVSELGARLRVGDPQTAPQEFLILLNKGLTRWCRVIWRSDTEIGVEFIEPPKSLKAKTK